MGARRRVWVPLFREKARRAAVGAGGGCPLRCDDQCGHGDGECASAEKQEDRDREGREIGEGAPEAGDAQELEWVGRDVAVRQEGPDDFPQGVLRFGWETLGDGGGEARGCDAGRGKAQGDGEKARRFAEEEGDGHRREGDEGGDVARSDHPAAPPEGMGDLEEQEIRDRQEGDQVEAAQPAWGQEREGRPGRPEEEAEPGREQRAVDALPGRWGDPHEAGRDVAHEPGVLQMTVRSGPGRAERAPVELRQHQGPGNRAGEKAQGAAPVAEKGGGGHDTRRGRARVFERHGERAEEPAPERPEISPERAEKCGPKRKCRHLVPGEHLSVRQREGSQGAGQRLVVDVAPVRVHRSPIDDAAGLELAGADAPGALLGERPGRVDADQLVGVVQPLEEDEEPAVRYQEEQEQAALAAAQSHAACYRTTGGQAGAPLSLLRMSVRKLPPGGSNMRSWMLLLAAFAIACGHYTAKATVTVAVSGPGAVRTPGLQGDCRGTCWFSVPRDAPVHLEPVIEGEATFAGWSGACSGTGACDLAPGVDVSVAATFMAAQPRRLQVSLNGAGTIRSDPAGIDCPRTCTADFPPGTAVRLDASASEGWDFSGFGGACGGPSCTLTLSNDISAWATFVQRPVNLAVQVSGRFQRESTVREPARGASPRAPRWRCRLLPTRFRSSAAGAEAAAAPPALWRSRRTRRSERSSGNAATSQWISGQRRGPIGASPPASVHTERSSPARGATRRRHSSGMAPCGRSGRRAGRLQQSTTQASLPAAIRLLRVTGTPFAGKMGR